MHSTHRRLVAVTFILLGLHVGVRAVQLADLAIALHLDAAQLGLAASSSAIAGIVTLVAGATLVDRLGRRPMLALGLVGSGLTFLAQAAVTDYLQFLAASLAYGLLISFLDLAANTLGSDLERATGDHAMTGFHSWFSLAAAVGATASALGLAAHTGFRPAFALLGAAMVVGGLWAVRQPMPPTSAAEPDVATTSAPRRLPLGVLLAVAIVFLCFFGDGILETFLAVLVRHQHSGPVWLAGATLAGFHLASWLGRRLSQRAMHRWSDKQVLVVSGLVASAAMTASLLLERPQVDHPVVGHGWLASAGYALVGFALVGLALAPIVPLGMSLAGRLAPSGSEGRAIGVTNAVGYSAFVLSPAVAGAIADRTSLVVGVGVAALTMLAISLTAVALPGRS